MSLAAADRESVLEKGCAQAGCIYNDSSWRPADGMMSPYDTGQGVFVPLCLSHGQLQLFTKE